MNVNELLQFVDRLVLEKTGRHLDDVQKAVIEGTYDRQTYDEIAQKCHITKNHASDVGSELWKLLSDILDEEIKKSNFRSNLERIYIKSSGKSSNIYNINSDNNHFYHSQTSSLPSGSSQENDINAQSKSIYHDLTSAPQIINFYNRETALKTLTNWIVNQNTRLISVLGLLGIGKTTLVKRFIDLNLDQFEVIIWKSLKYPKPLDLLLNDLLTTCQQEPKETLDNQLNQFFELLIDKKCLIILDDLQNLFSSGQLSGQYKPEYDNYKNFFKLITEIEHQSHFILISQEQCPEMHCFDNDFSTVKCLELSGIKTPDILNHKGLKNQERWLELIQLYEGNIFYLRKIAILINDIFDGSVSEFLAENDVVITQAMQFHLKALFNRLSPIEQQIALELTQVKQPLSKEELRNSLKLPSSDFINGLQSLRERYLVDKIFDEQIRFKLSPIFREYLIQSKLQK
jgi:hypothetical protein